MIRKTFSALALVMALTLSLGVAFKIHPAMADTPFKVTSGVGLGNTGAALQPDGKTVMCGRDSSWNVVLARFGTDGALDNTFGTNGAVTIDLNGQAFAVAIQSNGKIVVVGESWSNGFLVARFLSNGTLDTTFGSPNGYVATTFEAAGWEGAYAVAIQTNGQIVAAGYNYDNFPQFALARYNTDGSLDSGFGTGGKVVTQMGTDDAKAYAVAIKADGSIVAAGFGSYASYNIVLAQYTSGGALDTGFGTNGIVNTNFSGGSYEEARSVAIDANQKIVVGGYIDVINNGNTQFTVLRYNTDGGLDTSFSGDGVATIDINGSGRDDMAFSVAIQTNGKIVAAGYSDNTDNGFYDDFAVARFNTDGTLDTTFGSPNGYLITDFGGSEQAFSALVQPSDQKIIVAGESSVGFALVRYTTTGVVDTIGGAPAIIGNSLGIGTELGIANTAPTITSTADNSSAASPTNMGGNIIFTVSASDSNDDPMYIAICKENSVTAGSGTFPTCGGAGAWHVDSSSRPNPIVGATVTTSTTGLIGETYPWYAFVCDGNGTPGSCSAMVNAGSPFVVNHQPVLGTVAIGPTCGSSASVDPGNARMAKTMTDFSGLDDQALSAALQSDGKIVTAGWSDVVFAVARHNADGSLDSTFGTGGKVTTAIGNSYDSANSVAIQSDGKIVVGGQSNNGTNDDFALARYNPDGSLDNTFGTGGKVTTAIGSYNDWAYSVSIQADGKIAAAGASNNGSRYVFAVVRYNDNGSLDTGFGTGGKVTTAIGSVGDLINSIAIQSDGKIVAAGSSLVGIDRLFALARYNTNGSLDSSFGTGGKVTTAVAIDNMAQSVRIQADGKIVAAGSAMDSSYFNFGVARYNSDGSLDSSFGTGGKVTTQIGSANSFANSMVLQLDGKILVAGYSTGTWKDFTIARYNNDGALDSAFGTGGKITTDFASDDDVAQSVLVRPDGKIIAAGYTYNNTSYDFALARYTSSGVLDDLSGYACVSAAVTDADTNATSSLVDVHACSTNSFTGSACGGTTLCKITGVRNGQSGQCVVDGLVNIPTAHGDATAYPVYVFTVDSNGFQGSGTSTSGYAVTDIAPTVDTYSVQDIHPTAGGSVTTSFTTLVSDDNGWADIDTVDGLIYDSASGSGGTALSSGTCTPNERNCYLRAACTKAQSTPTQITATCDSITTWFNMDPTAPGVWKAHANAIDTGHTTVGADSATDIMVGALSAVAVTQPSIAYGGIAVGGTSSSSQTTTMQNVGNIVIDVGIHGTNMIDGSNSIPLAQQRWATDTGFAYLTGDHPLVADPESVPGTATTGCANRSVAVRAAHDSTATDSDLFWKLRIPDPQPTGSYSGSNTFTSVVDGLCTGTD